MPATSLFSYQPALLHSACALHWLLSWHEYQHSSGGHTLLITVGEHLALSAAEHPPAACLCSPQKSVTEKLKVEYDSSAEPETTAYTGYDGLPPPAEVGSSLSRLRLHSAA